MRKTHQCNNHLNIKQPSMDKDRSTETNCSSLTIPSIYGEFPAYSISPPMTTPTIHPSSSDSTTAQMDDTKYDKQFTFPAAKEPSNDYITQKEDDEYYSNSDSVIITEYSDGSQSCHNLIGADDLRNRIENNLKEQEEKLAENNHKESNAGECCQLNIKCDNAQVLQLNVHNSCSVHHVKCQIDNITNGLYNQCNIQYNHKVLPNDKSLKELGIGETAFLVYGNEPEIDPINWTEWDVSNWFISSGYDEFAAEQWLEQRIDGAALLLNIRPGHIRCDLLVENRDDVKNIMDEIKYLRDQSIGYQKQEIEKLQNKLNHHRKTNNQQRLHELEICRNILEVDLRKSCKEVEEFEHKMKEMNKQNTKLKDENNKLREQLAKNESKCKNVTNKYKKKYKKKYEKKYKNEKSKLFDNNCREIKNKRNKIKVTTEKMNDKNIAVDINRRVKDRNVRNVKIIRRNKVVGPKLNMPSQKRRQRRRSFVLQNGSIECLYDFKDQYAFKNDNGEIC